MSETQGPYGKHVTVNENKSLFEAGIARDHKVDKERERYEDRQEAEVVKLKEQLQVAVEGMISVNDQLDKQKKETQKYFFELGKAKTAIKEYNLLCSQKNFPIQRQYSTISSDGHSKKDLQPQTIIPYWLAEEAYKHYAAKFGSGQSLERLAERGGFGRKELLMLLRKEV